LIQSLTFLLYISNIAIGSSSKDLSTDLKLISFPLPPQIDENSKSIMIVYLLNLPSYFDHSQFWIENCKTFSDFVNSTNLKVSEKATYCLEVCFDTHVSLVILIILCIN
jgi:hypothetical protein